MKRISMLLVCCLAGFTLFAQTATFGLKGGLNLATNSNSNEAASPDLKLGYHAGFLVNLNVSPAISIQPELVYSNQGHKYTLTTDDMFGTYTQEHSLHLNYLNIPVLVQYKAGPQFRLQTGPQIGFLTSVNDAVDGESTGFFSSSDFKSTDFAWTFGLSFMGNSGIGVDARYNLGLSNINDVGSATIKNNVGQIGLVVLLR